MSQHNDATWMTLYIVDSNFSSLNAFNFHMCLAEYKLICRFTYYLYLDK